MTKKTDRFWPALTFVALILGASCIASFCTGPARISVRSTLGLLAARLSGEGSPNARDESILFSVRLPRIAGACLVGWGLGLAGLCFQSLLKNPLAEPYTLGLASGAAIGAVSASFFKIDFPMATQVLAFCGALITAAAVLFFARFNALHAHSVVLIGVLWGALANAFLSLMLSVVSPNQLQAFYYWLMGSLAHVDWPSIFTVTPVIAVLSAVVPALGWKMNVIGTNEELAAQVGIPVRRTRWILYATASLITALVVSLAGTIGFIGLVTPHLARLLVGTDNRRLAPLVALLGAAFCVLSDLAARTVLAPAELPVGVVTAFIGVPAFFYFMLRRKP